MSERETLRETFEDEFENVDFPVDSPMDLAPYLSRGPATTFEGEEVSISAMELANEISDHEDEAPNEGFPYEGIDAMIEDILYGLEESEIIRES